MIGRAMRLGLVAAGFMVDWVTNGIAAEVLFAANVYDLAVLDLRLPLQDGIEILRKLRLGGSKMPVLVATARDAVPERMISLDAGADGFLSKPFDLDDLTGQVRVLLSRADGATARILAAGSLSFDTVAHAATYAGGVVNLSAAEGAILEALMRSRGAALTAGQLDLAGAGRRHRDELRSLDEHVEALCEKLGEGIVKRVRGVGYRLAAR